MITLLVNGERRTVDTDPAMPLLWVLRDLLRLKGTKYSCGAGLCGSCTVHVDGEPTRSCITTVESVAGRRIKKVHVERHPPQVVEEPEEENRSIFRRNGNDNGKGN